MVIGVDLRAIGQGKYSGVEEYVLNLLGAMLAIDSNNQYIFFTSGGKTGQRYLDFSSETQNKNPNVALVHYRMPNLLLNGLFKFFGRPQIDRLMSEACPGQKKKIDIVFAPNINLLPVSGRVKVIATIHDLSFAKYKDFFSRRQNFWHRFVNPEALAKKAECIIAVSESTKKDLMEIYKIPEGKIKVIYSGIGQTLNTERKMENESDKLRNIKKKYNLPGKYILYLGTIEPRKNIIGLIKAFELFKKNHLPLAAGYKLVVAGSKGWLYEDIFRVARNSSAKEDIIFTDFIMDRDRPYLYKNASLFVYPSFYEGFGFPPLEAMAQGTAVITSDSSSLPEVVGEAGLMVNPHNISRLAWAIGEVLSNQELRKKMIEKGYEQVKKFSWDKCARETLAAFEAVNENY